MAAVAVSVTLQVAVVGAVERNCWWCWWHYVCSLSFATINRALGEAALYNSRSLRCCGLIIIIVMIIR
jgi:hypothetical protein